MDDGRITIRFELDENDNHYEASSTLSIYSDIGMNAIDEMGAQFNTFLKQAGYPRENDFIFMEDVTEDECIALDDFLHRYRNEQEGTHE